MKQIILFICFLLISIFSFSQNETIEPGWGTLNYSVPESPAFKIMGTNPDNILKPSNNDIKKITVSIGDYFINNSGVIPKAVAIEINPWLLLNPQTATNKYNSSDPKKHYRTKDFKISFGTNSKTNGSNDAAIGIRWSYRFDDNSILENPAYTLGLLAIHKGYESANQAYLKDHPDFCNIDYSEKYESDSNFKKSMDKKVSKEFLIELRKQWKEEHWNDKSLDFGFASLYSSPDSLVKNLVYSKLASWFTYGTHFLYDKGTQKDQLLFGGKYQSYDSMGISYSDISLGLRYYYGNSEYKLFTQGEWQQRNKLQTFVSSLGCNFIIKEGITGQFSFSAVYNYDDYTWVYKPAFSIGLGSKEKIIQ